MSARAKALLALWFAVAIWASTFVVSQDALRSVGPGVLTTLRFAVATLLLVPAALLRGARWRELLGVVPFVCGLTGVALYYGLQNIGLTTAEAGTAALLQAALPVATLALAVVWLRERVTRRELGGSTLTVLGIVLVVGAGLATPGLGELAILLGVLAYAVYTVYLRRHGAGLDPLPLAAGSALCGLVLLVPWALWEVADDGVPQLTGSALLAVAYLGAVASAGTLLLWTFGVGHVSATTAGAFTGAIPALGYLVALAAGEAWSWPRVVGGVVALVGVVVASTTATRPRRARPPG